MSQAAWPAGPCCGNLPPSRPGTQGTTHGTVSRPDTRGTVGTGASWCAAWKLPFETMGSQNKIRIWAIGFKP
eukprot:508020-Amphidinium_carterae.1